MRLLTQKIAAVAQTVPALIKASIGTKQKQTHYYTKRANLAIFMKLHSIVRKLFCINKLLRYFYRLRKEGYQLLSTRYTFFVIKALETFFVYKIVLFVKRFLYGRRRLLI